MRGAEEFFDRLGDIGWPSMALALAFYLAHLLARSRAWQNVLRAAYPDARRSPTAQITAAYLAGAGLNSFVPARVGDAVKIFLAKHSIRRSTYPAIVSSFFVQSVFDTTAGILVFVYALTQGLLPQPARAAGPAGLRHLVLGGESAPAGLHPDGARDRAGRPLRGARPPGRGLLGPGQAGGGRAHRRPPLPAHCRLLAGRRLDDALLRLLVLPRGLQHRRLLPERDAGDERAGDRHPPARSPRAAPAPSRPCSSRPSAARARSPSSPTRSASRSRSPPGRRSSGFLALVFVFRTTDWRTPHPPRRGRGRGAPGSNRDTRPPRKPLSHRCTRSQRFVAWEHGASTVRTRCRRTERLGH